MGNRAIITTKDRDLGLYLHWNGGRDSVEGFLAYCDLRGFRPPSYDPYGWARLCQVIANYFGADGLSVGISRYTTDERMDPGDNGIYVIDGWQIVERVGLYDGFQEQQVYPLDEMLAEIDAAQPQDQQLGADFLSAAVTPTQDIHVGDTVFVHDIRRIEPYKVVGYGEKMIVNGHDVLGVPIIARYLTDEGDVMLDNPNNYLFNREYRVKPAVVEEVIPF